MKIIPLSEGSFTIDKTKVFVPFNESDHNMADRTRGSLLVEVQPFVVITSQDVILIDTGLGFNNDNGVMQLHQNLMDNGINPSEVTKVLMSHLHKDHSGGVSHLDPADGKTKLSFPKAAYYVQRQELELALSDSGSSYIKKELECLDGARNLVLLNGSGRIDDYIWYEMTSAHSPFHQVFWIKEEGETAFFGGDDAPQLSQMKKKYIAKYDYDGRKCMELRQEWWEKGQAENWTFLFYHDIKTPLMTAKPV